MEKPKRLGTYLDCYRGYAKLDKHPYYSYRGYFIAREYGIANTPSSQFYAIYQALEHGIPVRYDFYLNPEDGFSRLKDAREAIDHYLEKRF